jgi:hypothetical protein
MIAKSPVQHSGRIGLPKIRRFTRNIQQSNVVQQVITSSKQTANQDNE